MFGKKLFSKLFAQQDVEQLKFEQKLKEMTVKDVVREFEVNKENKMEIKTEMSEQELVKNEEIVVEDAPEVSEETEVEVAEAIEEVVEEQQEEVEEVTEEPKPVEEGIEPPTEQAVETLDEEEVVEEEQPEEQEEPQEQIEEIEAKEEPEAPVAEVEEVAEEVVEEQVEVQEEVVEEEQPAETEQPAEPVVVEATPQNIEVPSAINVVSEQAVEISEVKTQDLLKEIENLKAEKAENEIKIAKMELSKSVEVDFAGVPGNIEDKTNMIYEIQNSALSSEAKDFILNSLKSLSVQNLSDCEEVGHDNEVEEDEKSKENKAIKEAMLEHGLTENQAFLYVRGDRTLNEAKRVSNKVKSKK